VFSADSGWEYHLELEGEYSDGTREAIDPAAWFRVRATALGGRLQEIPRDRETISALAEYVCSHVDREGPPERKLLSLSVVELAWRRPRGRRLQIADVPAGAATRHVWLDGHRCAKGIP
jgi:hypothetical protein